MGEEFYSVIKLVTGEELFSLVSIDENEGDPLVIMQNPVTMKMTKTRHGINLRVKSWMEIPSDDFFIVKLDKIVTMTEVKDEDIIELYNHYLEEDDMEDFSNPNNNQTKLTNKMGYISSVEDARETLEKIYKGLKES